MLVIADRVEVRAENDMYQKRGRIRNFKFDGLIACVQFDGEPELLYEIPIEDLAKETGA